jgi:hypothetical protein
MVIPAGLEPATYGLGNLLGSQTPQAKTARYPLPYPLFPLNFSGLAYSVLDTG